MLSDRREVQFPAKDEPEVILSGLLFTPETLKKPFVCVLVHPWGFLGGSRGNTFLYADRLSKKFGIQCLIFDCRGVGNSSGKASFNCSAEVADVIGACDWVTSNLSKPILLIGSSAGAAIAGSALDKVSQVLAYIGIGYTFGWLSSLIFGRHYDAISKSMKPKLFIMGTEDGFTSVSQLKSRLKHMQNAEMKLIDGVGHFSLESSTYASKTVELIAEYVDTLTF
jgi:alpha/beta superfamily hydrolase